ncbi:MAG: hypothetical protein QW658_03200 [Candidatus Bathyarchaeia archaeon]
MSKAIAVSRWWYSAAQDGVVFPRKLSRIHPKYKSSANAIMAWALGSLALDVIMGVIYGPENAAFILDAGTGISIILVHILANTSLTFFTRRIGEFRLLTHGIAPAAATAIGFVVVYFSMNDVVDKWLSRPSPINDAYFASLIATLLWVILGGLAVTMYYSRHRPNTLVRAGEYDMEGVSYTGFKKNQ